MTVDYGRFGRQIALAELGPRGQEALRSHGVSAPAEALDLASALWSAAGGGDGARADGALPRATEVEQASVLLGVAAWSCVESARRSLALGPDARIPEALLQRLDPTR